MVRRFPKWGRINLLKWEIDIKRYLLKWEIKESTLKLRKSKEISTIILQ
jgi:hypothetical protein